MIDLFMFRSTVRCVELGRCFHLQRRPPLPSSSLSLLSRAHNSSHLYISHVFIIVLMINLLSKARNHVSTSPQLFIFIHSFIRFAAVERWSAFVSWQTFICLARYRRLSFQQLMNMKLMLMNQKFNYFNRCSAISSPPFSVRPNAI